MFFPSRANGGPSAARKFHLSATQNGTMEEFCQRVSNATGVPLERLVCVEIHGHKVFKVLYELSSNTNSKVRELAKGDIIHMYELEAPVIAQHEAAKMTDVPLPPDADGYVPPCKDAPRRQDVFPNAVPLTD